jgi:hypothetical protein
MLLGLYVIQAARSCLFAYAKAKNLSLIPDSDLEKKHHRGHHGLAGNHNGNGRFVLACQSRPPLPQVHKPKPLSVRCEI